jgi:uncharacterized protein
MYMKSTATLATQQAERIAKRLVNHWKHKFEVKENRAGFEIMLPNATVVLEPNAEYLAVSIIFLEEPDNPTQLENIVLDHLIRMGQEQLVANWQRN